MFRKLISQLFILVLLWTSTFLHDTFSPQVHLDSLEQMQNSISACGASEGCPANRLSHCHQPASLSNLDLEKILPKLLVIFVTVAVAVALWLLHRVFEKTYLPHHRRRFFIPIHVPRFIELRTLLI